MRACLEVNMPLLYRAAHRVPFSAALKCTAALDGKVGTGQGRVGWLATKISPDRVFLLSGRSDAVIVGVNTVGRDSCVFQDGNASVSCSSCFRAPCSTRTGYGTRAMGSKMLHSTQRMMPLLDHNVGRADRPCRPGRAATNAAVMDAEVSEQENPGGTASGIQHKATEPVERTGDSPSISKERAVKISPFADIGFKSLRLSPLLMRRLREIELTRPTNVQAAAIPVLIDGHDAAMQSYTGSGKTLAYLLPLLTRIGPLKIRAEVQTAEVGKREASAGIEAVIVAPSRELAMQIVREIERIVGVDQRHVVQQLIGGANQRRQEEGLKKHKPSIVVGTPGRISDLSRSGRLQTHNCKMLILDEAEQLLLPNFKQDMVRILEHVGTRRLSASSQSVPVDSQRIQKKLERQTVLVSATLPPSVVLAAGRWGYEPVVVRVGTTVEVRPWDAENVAGSSKGGNGAALQKAEAELEVVVPPNLDHWLLVTHQRHKVDAVRRAVHATDARKALVFMNFGRRLKDAEHKLAAKGLSVGCLHGDLGKVERANVLAGFRDGGLRILLVSEVAARGLDITDCDLVINLELPTDASHYGHRAGRTGRMGKKGVVVSICEEREAFVLEKFAKRLGISMLRGDVKEGRLVELNNREQRGDSLDDYPIEPPAVKNVRRG